MGDLWEGSWGTAALKFRLGAAGKANHLGQGLGCVVPFPSTFQTQRGLFANHVLANNVGGKEAARSSTSPGRVVTRPEGMWQPSG